MGDLGSDQFICANCHVPANQRCTGCHETFYCSRECQKLHWKKHKNQCCAFKVCSSSDQTMGRYIIATRDLKPGELILTESPLAIGPPAVTPPLCLACYKPVDGRYRCPKCGWPMCNEACALSPVHRPECEMTVARGSPINIEVNPLKPFPLYEAVCIMRCLAFKNTDPAKYKALMALEPHTEARRATGRYDRDRATMVRVLRQFFKLSKSVVSDDEILHVCGILFVNAHELPVTATPTQAVFKNASLIEHSCCNNASKHFDMNCNIQIRAAVPIKKGDRISIMYSDPMWGTMNRQGHLQETKCFTCTCPRCSDPTELGTDFSSLRCPDCPGGSGYLSPATVDAETWSCSGCKKTEPADNYVNAVIRSIGEELVRLERGSPEACQNFIKKHSQNLHPNHYYLMDVKLALCQMIGQATQSSELSEKDLVQKQKLCMDILNIANRISPGISRLRGVIMYELQGVLSAYARRKFSSGEISTDHLKNIMKEVKKYLRECIQIFSYEPTCIQEGRLAAIARLDLVELETFVDSIDKSVAIDKGN